MLRRFNYTGRKQIPRSAVSVQVRRDGNGASSFDATFDISQMKLPSHAKVYLEAYHRASYMRFDYGCVSDIRPPQDRKLTDIEGNGTPQFRLKVVDETTEHGCVLAEADGVAPLDGDAEEAGRNSILPVVDADLGDQVWRVNFDTYDGRPELELNRAIEGIKRMAETDDTFLCLVYPAVVRQVLTRVVRIEGFAELDGPPEDWRVQWLKFACSLPSVMKPPKPDGDEDESVELKQLEWIEDVATAFSSKHRIFERFVRTVAREDF